MSRSKTEKRKTQDQDVDIKDGKKVQSCETKLSEPTTQDDTVNSSKINGDNKSGACPKMAGEFDMGEGFTFGGYKFNEIIDGKIRCGVCQVDCIRLVFHLNGNKKCSEKKLGDHQF